MNTFIAEDSREYRRTYLNDHIHTEFTQPDVHKMIPNKISLEKVSKGVRVHLINYLVQERLYEDTLHLKKNVNRLAEENLKIKSRNHQLEVCNKFIDTFFKRYFKQENAKLTKMLEGLSGHGNMNIFGPKVTEVASLSKIYQTLIF